MSRITNFITKELVGVFEKFSPTGTSVKWELCNEGTVFHHPSTAEVSLAETDLLFLPREILVDVRRSGHVWGPEGIEAPQYLLLQRFNEFYRSHDRTSMMVCSD